MSFSEFHAAYLLHTAEEERVTDPLLWKHFSDEELMDHRAQILANTPPPTLLVWFKFVIPAQSQHERIELLSGFRKMAPKKFFKEAVKMIRRVLPGKEFSEMKKLLK